VYLASNITQYRIAIWSQIKDVLGEHVKIIEDTRIFIREIKTQLRSHAGSLLLSFERDPRVGEERVCSVLKLQLWVMKFTVNLQQEIVKRTLKLIFIS
jgi:hypothetical protein